ncbi:hypothetical protein BC833DRAFT_123490 [Globomyces pollinis-pini]|nr:hypothetical protein BC833DRAFT_123490 [Globomyces pollinis-pini]
MVQRVDDLEKIIEGPINQSALNLSSNVDLSKPTKLNTTLLKMENEELTARVDAKQLELEKYIENSNFNSSQVQSLRVDLEDLEETVEYQQEEILTLRQLNKDLQLKVESNQEFKNVTPGKDSQQNIAVSDQERNMDLQKISGLEKVISLLQDENRAITDSLRLANIEVSDLKKTTEDSINVKESAELLKSLICSLAKFSNQSVSSSQKSENENEVKKIWATANKSQNDLVKEAITSLMENIKKMGEYQEYKVLIESQVTHLREKLKISESDYREELDKLTSQINVLEKNVTNQQPQVLQLQSMEKQMVELKNIVMEQQEKLDDAAEEKRLKEFKIMELEKRLMETNATQQLQEKILLNEMEIKQLREQVKLMSSRDAEMANIKSNIQREKDMLQQEIVDLQSTIDSLYSKIAQSKSAAAAKESEFEEIRMNLEEELHLMREKQKNKGKVVEEDPSKTLTLSNSLQEAKKELQELRTTFKTETDNHLVLKSHLESELQSAQSKIKEITVEFDLLSSNHKETLKLMEKLKLDTASELAESNSELGEKFTAVLVELDAERKNSQGIFQKYEKLKIETEKCEMFFDSIGKRFDVLLQESEQINDPKLNHLDYPTGDHTKLSKQQILIENKINEISSFISKKSSELANMHKNYSQLQESLSQSQNDTESKEYCNLKLILGLY